MYFFYNCFFYFLLLFVNITYTRWCIIGQVLNGEWKELLIRQVIITSAPTNIFTPYMYAFLFPPMCSCILSLRVCPPILLRHVFLFPPMCVCNQSKRVCPPNTFTTCIYIFANVYLYLIITSAPTSTFTTCISISDNE